MSAYLLDAEGFYRVPYEHVYWFVMLSNLRVVDVRSPAASGRTVDD